MSEFRLATNPKETFKETIVKLMNTVGSTFGPGGNTVIIERKFADPIITKDGVTVSRNYNLKDGLSNMALDIIKQSAEKTLKEAGDGTTSTIVLASTLYLNGLESLSQMVSPNKTQYAAGMRFCLREILIPTLKSLAREVKGIEDIRDIAMVSTNSDVELTNTIVKAFEAVGTDGIITNEEYSGLNDIIDITSGFTFDEGIMNPAFINNKNKLTVEYDEALVLVLEQRLSNVQQIEDILIEVKKMGKPLILLAREFENNIAPILALNKIKTGLEVVPVLLPGVADDKIESAKNIAAFTGATSINSNDGISFANIDVSHLGKVGKVVITERETTLVRIEGQDRIKLDERIKNVKFRIENTDSVYEKTKLERALGQLNGKVANVKLAANSSSEFRERKDRFDDAISACRVADKYGVIAGGTGTYIFMSIALSRDVSPDAYVDVMEMYGENRAFLAGIDDVILNLRSLTYTLLHNLDVSITDTEEFFEEVGNMIKEGKLGYGFTINLKDMSLASADELKIIDPLKVAIEVLTNAVSTASTLLTSEVALYLDNK